MQYNNVFLDWLHRRKISDEIIEKFGIHFGHHYSIGQCIIIPIKDKDGNFSFNKYRRNPLDPRTPKYLYDKGGKMTLYGADKIKDCNKILVCEGEMDALVAWSANIPAVSSTGGALSFPNEWAEILKGKEVILCFDNDEAGGNGMTKALSVIPSAKIIFLPDRPGVKDISDYVTNGGDLNLLLKTAIELNTLEKIIDHRSERASVWQSTFFHDAYIKEHTKPIPEKKEHRDRSKIKDEILRAKLYPIDTLVEFNDHKARCLWHSEKTASMHFYSDTNKVHCFGCGKSADSIDVYMQMFNCSFKEAVIKLQ